MGLSWATTVLFALNCTSHLQFLYDVKTVCLEVTSCCEIVDGPWLALSSENAKACLASILSMIKKKMTHYKNESICQTSNILGFNKQTLAGLSLVTKLR